MYLSHYPSNTTLVSEDKENPKMSIVYCSAPNTKQYYM